MATSYDIRSLGASTARLIEGKGNIFDLPVATVRNWLIAHGALVFRGFGATPLIMKEFADRYSVRFNRDRLRPPVENSDGFVQLVTEGMGYVEPHAEQANTPFRPDAIWFCCETPAAEGGETLLWDGVEVFNRLAPDSRSRFRGKSIRFFQRYLPVQWKLFIGGDETLDEARQKLDGIDRLTYHVDKNETIYLEYLCPAVVRTRYGNEEAFANSLISERANTLGSLMTFEDGDPITDQDIAEVQRALDNVKEAIAWQPGDLAMIDNSRYMHGRNAYRDTRRKIYSSLSYLNF